MKRVLTAGLFALIGTASAFAQTSIGQTWAERSYDPPIGSRWIVQVKSNSEEKRHDGARTIQVRSKSEFTVDEKLPTGFRISYVNRELNVEGTAPAVALLGPAFAGMKDIVVRATTDKTGKPVEVDNIAEVQAVMRTVIERTVGAFKDKPQLAEVLQQLMTGMLIVDGKQAALAYLEELPQLALGQSTGLKPGEERHETEEAPSPLGGLPIKSNTTLRIDSADAQTGKVRLVRTRSLDPEAVRGLALNIVRQMGVAVDKPMLPEVLEVMKAMQFSIDNRLEIDVEDGITRALREETTTTVNAAGHAYTKHERKQVTVSPAP